MPTTQLALRGSVIANRHAFSIDVSIANWLAWVPVSSNVTSRCGERSVFVTVTSLRSLTVPRCVVKSRLDGVGVACAAAVSATARAAVPSTATASAISIALR